MKSRKFYLLVVILIIIFATLCYFIIKEEPKTELKTVNESQEKKEPEVKEERLSLIMVGDALLHSSLYRDGYQNGTYDFTSQLEFIKPEIQKHDLAFYNQESILGGTSIGLSDYPNFNSPQEFGDAMIDAGFNLVSLANNHTMDRGVTAIQNSCDYWKTKDVLTAGSYCSAEDAEEIKIKEKNGIKYTMLAYTYGTNGITVPSDKPYLVNLYSDELAKADIEKVRDKVDLLIVSMHWGAEYRSEPTEEQKREAEYLSNLGVDIIIGTHPHVIEPITYINDTLVIYSLGNFISAQSTNNDYNTMVELMTSVDVVKTTKDGQSEIKLENLNNELLYNYYQKDSRWHNFKVIPFSQMNETYNSDYKRLYEKYSSVVRMYNPNIEINPCA